MDILDVIRTHSQPEKIRTVEVPEWGRPAELDAEGEVVTPAEPLVIHYRMVTLEDMAEAQAAAALTGGGPLRQAVELICLKACKPDGTPLFKRIDARELMQIAAIEVVLRLSDAMGRRLSSEELRKNS